MLCRLLDEASNYSSQYSQLTGEESCKHESPGQPLSECVFVDINHQEEGKSARLFL